VNPVNTLNNLIRSPLTLTVALLLPGLFNFPNSTAIAQSVNPAPDPSAVPTSTVPTPTAAPTVPASSPAPGAKPTVDSRKLEADRLLLQGLQELQAEQFDAAILFWEQGLKHYRQLSDPWGESLTLLGLSQATKRRPGPQTAGSDSFEQSLRLARQLKGPSSDPLYSTVGLALAYDYLGKETRPLSKIYGQWAIARKNRDRPREQAILQEIGKAYATLEQPARSAQAYQQWLEFTQRPEDAAAAGQVRALLGKTYFTLGENARSIEYHQRSLGTVQAENGPAGPINIWLRLGRSYSAIGDYDKAANYYQMGHDIAKASKMPQVQATALIGLAHTHAAQGNYIPAMLANQQAQEIISNQQLKNFVSIVQAGLLAVNMIIDPQYFSKSGNQNSLNNLSFVGVGIGKAYISLRGFYSFSLEVAQGSQDERGQVSALFGLGRSLSAGGEYAKAVDHYNKSLAIAEKLGDVSGQWAALTGLSRAYEALGEITQAQSYYQRSLEVARVLKTQQSGAAQQTRLTIAYRALGEYGKAIDFYQQSLNLASGGSGDVDQQWLALIGLGASYGAIAEHQQALEYYQQAQLRLPQGQSDPRQLTTLLSVSAEQVALGQYAAALENYKKSATLAQILTDLPSAQTALLGLAQIHLLLDQRPQAGVQYQKSIQIAKNLQQDLRPERKAQVSTVTGGARIAQFGLANIALLNGKYDEAIRIYQQIQAEGTASESSPEAKAAFVELNQTDQHKVLQGLGQAYEGLNDSAKATQIYKQVLDSAKRQGNPVAQSAALNQLGQVLQKSGQWAESEKMLRESIALRESLRENLRDADKVMLFEIQRSAYNTLQQVLVAQNKPEQALEIAERGRARALVELLSQRLLPQPAKPTKLTPPTVDQIRQIAKDQNATLVQYSILPEPVTPGGPLRDSELLIWVIQPTGQITLRRADIKPLLAQGASSLNDLVVGNQEFLAVRGRNALTVSSRGAKRSLPSAAPTSSPSPALYQLLIAPIQDLLPKNERDRVVFIPQGPLFQVPFAALQNPQGEYLIQSHTLLTAPSIQALDLTRQQRLALAQQPPSSPGALIVGNPQMPSVTLAPGSPPEPLAPLPGAEQEAKAIAALLKGPALIGPQATKAAVKQQMPQARRIHLATHGLLDEIQGLSSAIALTPSAGDNGLLSAEEIFDLPLQADLVVLSACNSGQGKITGDGVIGLSRSLLAAGAASVVVSLWAVPDAPTAELMTQFYQNLQSQPEAQRDKAQALRQAMLTTLKTHPDPRNWAAFTLMGEAQ
jgi:CHAT domain-containing protein